MIVEVQEYPAVTGYDRVYIALYSQAFDGPSGTCTCVYSEQWLAEMPAGVSALDVAQSVAASAGFVLVDTAGVADLGVWDAPIGSPARKGPKAPPEGAPPARPKVSAYELLPTGKAAMAAQKAASEMAATRAPIWVRESAASAAFIQSTYAPHASYYKVV